MSLGTVVIVVLPNGKELQGCVVQQVKGQVEVELACGERKWYCRFRVFEK